MKLFDGRWQGAHGIGRFATEIRRRLTEFENVELAGDPWGPIDPWRLARHLRARKPEIFLSPGYNAPLGLPCPFVFCVHDLNHLVVHDNSSALKRAYYRYIMLPAAHKANAVLTVSEFSRRALCEWTGLGAERIVNVGNGVSAAFKPEGGRHATSKPYFLCIGSDKPHKNLPRIFQAFAQSRLARDFHLLCTGQPSRRMQRVLDKASIGQHVSFAGTVTDERLAELYRGATALIFVSLYEGFGLPVAEAMACGTPVLTAAAASLPEVAGDAALLVEPTHTDAICDGMVRLAGDSALRAALRKRGLQRAKAFSWDATAMRVKQSLRLAAA